TALSTWVRETDLAMLDSLSALIPGTDENDVAAMTLVGEALKRVRAAGGGSLLAVHHSAKIAWKPSEAPSLAHLRGHSALAGIVDTVLALVPADSPEGLVSFDLHVVKRRDEERARPRRYTIAMR